MGFEQTWRWFGPHDPITLPEIRQTGATGIVSALHHIPVGDVWPMEEIRARKKLIDDAGLRWSVVESLPVHDEIKTWSGQVQKYVDNYAQSLRHLGACGIRTVCYNFMPLLDWSRTDLAVRFADGSITSSFDLHIFAAFDLHILCRAGAEHDYPPEVIREADKYFSALNAEGRQKLTDTVLLGFPGSGEAYTVDRFRAALHRYEGMGAEELRDHLAQFLAAIVPVAAGAHVALAIHPDDPPWALLGLPRVVSNDADLERIVHMVESNANGLTLCSGSLGASPQNNVPEIARRFAERINFVHLRNVHTLREKSFVEDEHLSGNVDMYGVVKALLLEQQRRNAAGREDFQLPMRPDHGHLMLDDQQGRTFYPGYSLVGRLRGLAELRGLEMGIARSLGL
jgi:mannonate dehydratase